MPRTEFEEYVRLERQHIDAYPGSVSTINTLRRMRAMAVEDYEWEENRTDKRRSEIIMTKMSSTATSRMIDNLIAELEKRNAN
mgnify:CR=1 FL=1